MTHDELRKFSIENKKFYYDLHGKKLIKCSAFLVVMWQELAQGVGGHIGLVSDNECAIAGQGMYPRNVACCEETGGSCENLASACGAWLCSC